MIPRRGLSFPRVSRRFLFFILLLYVKKKKQQENIMRTYYLSISKAKPTKGVVGWDGNISNSWFNLIILFCFDVLRGWQICHFFYWLILFYFNLIWSIKWYLSRCKVKQWVSQDPWGPTFSSSHQNPYETMCYFPYISIIIN